MVTHNTVAEDNQKGNTTHYSFNSLALPVYQAAAVNETQRLHALLETKSRRLLALKNADLFTYSPDEALRLTAERQSLEEDLAVLLGYKLVTDGQQEAYQKSLQWIDDFFKDRHQQQQIEIARLKQLVNYHQQLYLNEAESHRLTLELWEKYCGGQ